MLGKIEGKRGGWVGQQRIRRLESITNSKDMTLSRLMETVEARKPGVLQSMGSQRVGHNLATEQQQILLYLLVLALGTGTTQLAGT